MVWHESKRWGMNYCGQDRRGQVIKGRCDSGAYGDWNGGFWLTLTLGWISVIGWSEMLSLGVRHQKCGVWNQGANSPFSSRLLWVHLELCLQPWTSVLWGLFDSLGCVGGERKEAVIGNRPKPLSRKHSWKNWGCLAGNQACVQSSSDNMTDSWEKGWVSSCGPRGLSQVYRWGP